MQPLSGDLTRLDGYTENDFGWNAPQEIFETTLYDYESGSAYKRYYDIIVLGDSFSHHFPLSQWQNYLVQLTGLTIVSYHLDWVDLDEFFKSPALRKTPPKIIILETSERTFTAWGKRIGLKEDCRRLPNPDFSRNPLTIKPLHHSINTYEREAPFGLLHPNISTGVHYLKHNIKIMINKKSTRAFKFSLKQNTFFSNRMSDYLLVYRDDVLKLNTKEEEVKKAVCKFTALQNTIQKNRKTLLVTLLAPDKLTAYSSFLESDKYKNNSWYDLIKSANALNIPPLKAAIESAINNKVQDVYLPNDTHWGSAGQKITAETLYEYLLEHGVIIR